MALNGAAARIIDGEVDLNAENLNSLDMGGNVYAHAGGGLNVGVSAIRGLINNVEIVYAGISSQALTGSATNYLYIDSSGVLVVNTSGFPSYPGTKYFPLATVVCGSATITSITDRRWKFFA